MRLMSELSLQEAIELYYQKHHAIHHGNFTKLLELKKYCPELFEKKHDDMIRGIIEDAKLFQSTERYKELCRLDLKSKFEVITNETSQPEE